MDSVVIVGGGVIGTSVAYALRDSSTDIVLLEKNALGSGTTSKSIAVFSWMKATPSKYDHELKSRSWSVYADLIEEGTLSYERIGALLVAQTTAFRSQLETASEQLREFGLDVKLLSPAELGEFGIEPAETEGALYTPDEGYLDPHEIVQHWADEARNAGADIRTGVEVTDIRTEGGTVTAVETTEGKFEADCVVNAAGPWSPEVNRMVDVSMPLRHTYGRILVLQLEDEFTLPYTLFESGDYFRGEGRDQAFAGRLEKEYDDAFTVDPDENHSIEGSFYEDVAEHSKTLIPRLAEAEVVNDWVGLRTVTPDKKPIVDSTTVEGFLVATGMSGLGITYAPAVGELLADYIDTGEKNPSLSKLAADRFD